MINKFYLRSLNFLTKGLTNQCYREFAQKNFTSKIPKLPIEKDYTLNGLARVLYKRLEKTNQEYKSINEQLLKGQENLSSQIKEKFRIKLNDLQISNDLFEKMNQTIAYLNELKQQQIKEKNDKEMIQLINEEFEVSEKKLIEQQSKAIEVLIPKDEYDDSQEITLEIRPGVGGSESSLFAEDIFNMYQAYFSTQGWNYKVVTHQKDGTVSKGCKVGIMKANGEEIYKKLKCESGVHKVIRVPETENKGRLHSSTISVVVLPIINQEFQVNEQDMRFEFMRAQGAGGQHVNKTESACRVTHIPTGITVSIQDDRSQLRNKEKAIKILKERLFTMHVQKQQQKESNQRMEQMGSSDRSDKIRTYNYPQSRITDHRTNLTHFGIEKMLEGEFLDSFIKSYLDKIYNDKLSLFMQELEKDQ